MDTIIIQKLREKLNLYKNECQVQFPDEQRPATIAEIRELSKQTFYILNSFLEVLEDQ